MSGGGRSSARGWEPVYRVVRRIPAGRVATYGQVAALAGMPRAARQVGWALHALDAEDAVPWHRVIDARGRISMRSGERAVESLQRARLRAEGVDFDPRGRVDLDRFRWRPPGWRDGDAVARRGASAGRRRDAEREGAR